MKRILIPLLVLALLCVCAAAPAEGNTVTLELNTAKLQAYAAGDPFLDGLTAEGNTLPVIVMNVNRSIYPQVTVLPKTVRNKKVTLSVDNGDVIRVKGSGLTAVKQGEAVLTIASEEDPSAVLQYRIVAVQPVTKITLAAPEKTVAAGGTMTLTAACIPGDATRQQVAWSSQHEEIATVDQNGVVTGVNRGTAVITAAAQDGSNIRAYINVRVVRSAEEIVLDPSEKAIDVGRTFLPRATVLPKDADNKNLVWTSSDERVATVGSQGRITAVALGDCEITCTSAENGEVQAKMSVHVQQPVLRVTIHEAPYVYNGESAQLSWVVEPSDASNPKLAFRSADERIATVDENGVITGVAGGNTYVRAVSTDGSNRQASMLVRVRQHLTGVHMRRHTAYIERGEAAVTDAVLEPVNGKNLNPEMTWESADTSIANVTTVTNHPNKVRIYGADYGDTTVTGTTQDGGFQASILVKVGRWDNSLRIAKVSMSGGDMLFQVKNVSDLTITSVKVECECFGADGKAAAGINPDDGSNILKFSYGRHLGPGGVTKEDAWRLASGYDRNIDFTSMNVRITEFQIENDWVKVIRKGNRKHYLFIK